MDNQKAVVIEHTSERLRFNPGFVMRAERYGFVPHACQPHRPQTKGKDERMVGYTKHNFFVRYHVFESFAHLNQLLEQWLGEVADPHCHGTLKVFDADDRLVATHRLCGAAAGWQIVAEHHARLWQAAYRVAPAP